jgi:CubicO group peptidase (beta-lactamase class C family)
VTLRQLLCHRAGMVPHGFWGYRESEQPPPTLQQILNSRDQMLGWLTANKLGPVKVVERPGSRYRYSGGGYCVVQKVIEDVTGESFEVAMRRLILEPLQMNRSSFDQPPGEDDTSNMAHGYGWLCLMGGRWRVFPQKAPGGLWTTPSDLARLIIALQEANAGAAVGPITPQIARQFLTPQFDGWMGMGVFLDGDETNGSRGFWHAGENFGYFARFGAGASNGHGWVIMNNGEKDCFQPILEAFDLNREPP